MSILLGYWRMPLKFIQIYLMLKKELRVNIPNPCITHKQSMMLEI